VSPMAIGGCAAALASSISRSTPNAPPRASLELAAGLSQRVAGCSSESLPVLAHHPSPWLRTLTKLRF